MSFETPETTEKKEESEKDKKKERPDTTNVEKTSKKLAEIKAQEKEDKQSEKDPDEELDEKLQSIESNEKTLKASLVDKLQGLEGNTYKEGTLKVNIDTSEGNQIPLKFDIDNEKLTIGEDIYNINLPYGASFDKVNFQDGNINITGSAWGQSDTGSISYNEFSEEIFSKIVDGSPKQISKTLDSGEVKFKKVA